MNPAFVIVGVGSLVIGALFAAFPKFIGVWINRTNRSIWERHQDDIPFTPNFIDDAKVPGKFRLLGIVFLVQAVVLFILAAVIPHGR